ncbi:MAG: aminoacetone oxidase family FAD-binding enzyme [Clostridiales bacterium]|nr:aminoacetone oxidase family FAD-binding enzyme [Clostridiales bacterium]
MGGKLPSYDVVIIGGGASGLMAACVASPGHRVLLLERGHVFGKKLRITGKGRCNLTNDCTAAEAVENIPTGGKFLQSAMHAFPPKSTKAFFEDLGVPLKTERGRRVFPVSDNAHDIADALVKRVLKSGTETRTARVQRVLTNNGKVGGVVADGHEIPCSAVIVTTGGLSYPITGSTGDGYKMASALGHTVVPTRGSLVPLESDDGFCARMRGLSLRNVGIAVTDGGKKPVYTDFGELLFTHFGISGPLTLSASAHMRDFENKKYRVVIDLKPALDGEALDRRILRDFEEQKNRDFANSLGGLVNRLMIPVIIERSGIAPDKKVHSITREERGRLGALLKSFDVGISRPRPADEAVITSGGVDTRELVPATMESKLVRGLYFAGEVINADAYTGGYNLQIAWSTAHAAAAAVQLAYL